MIYRQFGHLDWAVSQVGLGVLQLPSLRQNPGNAGMRQRMEALRYAVDQGVNFISLGYPYLLCDPAEGCSYIREALAGGCRDKLKTFVNIPVYLTEKEEDLDRYLFEQLTWFGLQGSEFLVLDGVNRLTWETLKKLRFEAWLKKMLESKLVGHVGFSFHDDCGILQQVIGGFDRWSFVQFEYSIMDYKHHPGVSGLEAARKNGLAVTVSGGLKDGRLLRAVPDSVQRIRNEAAVKRTAMEWPLRWLYHHQEISTAFFEFESPVQVEQLLSAAEVCTPGMLDIFEQLQANKIRDAYNAGRFVQCTACRCCMPCPAGVDAPRIIELYNDAVIYGNREIPQLLYQLEGHRKLTCTKCGTCEKSCPKRIPLIQVLDQAADLFDDYISRSS